MRSSAIRLVLIAGLLLLALPGAAAEAAQTFTVTRTPDSNVGGCEPTFCTLRQGIEAAEAAGAGSKVIVPAGTYTLSFGELRVGKPISIEGAGASLTKVDAGGASRVFDVTATATAARLAKLTVQNGRLTSKMGVSGGGGIRNLGSLTLEAVVVRANTVNPEEGSFELENGGGGIFNKGSLTILGSEIAENIVEPAVPKTAAYRNPGGGIQSEGALRIVDSAVVRNVAAGRYPTGGIASAGLTANSASAELIRTRIENNKSEGGVEAIAFSAGIYAQRTDLTVRESTIADNRATGPDVRGTALFFGYEGNLAFESSTVAGNVSAGTTVASGAFEIEGHAGDSLRIVNSTLVGNEANAPNARGGGILHGGESNLEVISSTLVGNRAVGSSAIGGNLRVAATTISDSIVAAGVAAPGAENCSSKGLISLGHNIDSTNQCGFAAAGDKVNTEPLLAALSANGGPTATMALLAGSPALDAGANCPATDQRGVVRPQGSACDIGAYELIVPSPSPTPPAPPTPPHAASLGFLAKKVKVAAKSGKGNFKVSCAADSGDRCDVALTLRVKPRKHHGARASAKKPKSVAGTVSGSIAGGTVGRLRVKLNARGRALLQTKTKGFAVIATGTSRNAAGAAVAVRHGLRIVPRASAHR